MNDSIDTQRRALLGAAATITALGASDTFGASDSDSNSATIVVPAFDSSTKLKPLSFNPARLNGLSERLLRSHWKNNYGGSVRALRVVNSLGRDISPFSSIVYEK